ncbi:hypothetical protein TNIN_392881 [Trichonephila inaurata madagascariensis]|uniref:Uncharacterized protein n=1 Tax=Trichonephila inaurata madagascariensis TaxID=2747483 RepID=A0A8X6X8L8_9ARAC|nr:hypothetical protein TNIN_392881 [Trichonephila inaurata madagascariensis]
MRSDQNVWLNGDFGYVEKKEVILAHLSLNGICAVYISKGLFELFPVWILGDAPSPSVARRILFTKCTLTKYVREVNLHRIT